MDPFAIHGETCTYKIIYIEFMDRCTLATKRSPDVSMGRDPSKIEEKIKNKRATYAPSLFLPLDSSTCDKIKFLRSFNHNKVNAGTVKTRKVDQTTWDQV